MTRRGIARLTAAVVLVVGGVACSADATGPSSSAAASAGDPTTDKLAQVLARGTLLLSVDVEYPPQSFLVEGAARATGTKCALNQLTGPEVDGFDVATSKAVAAALGVEPCFVAVQWNTVIAGSWADRWDAAWGSGALTEERMTRLFVTQPYYALANYFYVRADSMVNAATELDGETVGACAGCTHELYLRHELALPGVTLEFLVDDADIVTYDTEPPGLEALADGDVDAFLSGESVAEEAIANGLPLRRLPEVVFFEQLTGYLDRSSSLDHGPMLARVDEIVRGLHADGTLTAYSEQYFDVDFTAAAAAFDMSTIEQSRD
jgi:polar amino acid transport system substrate-binding protein